VCLLKPDNNVETINIFLAPPKHTNPLSRATRHSKIEEDPRRKPSDHPKTMMQMGGEMEREGGGQKKKRRRIQMETHHQVRWW